MIRRLAGWLAGRDALPTTFRAVLGYYAHSGVFDVGSVRLKRRVDETTDEMIDDAFGAVERELAAAFDRETVEFGYDTKLVLPAELTLGYHYRTLDDAAAIREVEGLTSLAIEALIDGDMRDARNDDEYDDFEVDFPTDETDRARIATVAQETLQERVAARFDDFGDEVADLYDWAVEISEEHQAQDRHFRALMAAAAGGEERAGDVEDVPDVGEGRRDGSTDGGTVSRSDARERIRAEYKHADFDAPPEVFDESELDLPYLKTQYDRVGVIYDGMCRMYDAAGYPVPGAFRKSIVLAIVGAQLWLDDIDDYAADRRQGQLTPVTAEYLLADDETEAYRAVVATTEQYLDLAREHATAADSTLTGIATAYIYRSGTPSTLPGSDAG
jgi:hypothetical protein